MLHGANSEKRDDQKVIANSCAASAVGDRHYRLGVAFPAGAATIDDALKNLRSLSPAQRKAVLEENARKEGEVVWYTSMSLTDFPKLSVLSRKLFPTSKLEPIG